MAHKVEQRQLKHRGRVFHFVSYEGRPANAARGQSASAPAWFLMNEGTRWEVVPHIAQEEPADLDRRLLHWLDQTLDPPSDAAFLSSAVTSPVAPAGKRRSDRQDDGGNARLWP